MAHLVGDAQYHMTMFSANISVLALNLKSHCPLWKEQNNRKWKSQQQ